MKWFTSRIERNDDVGGGFSLLCLSGCGALGAARPGQFAMLRGEWGRDPILPRAISLLDMEGDEARFLIRRIGRGTRLLGRAARGDRVSVLGPLGTWFPPVRDEGVDLLVAGGCGLPPLFFAARCAAAAGKPHQVELLIGARRRAELEPLEAITGGVIGVTTIAEEGPVGEAGRVTDLLERRLARAGGDPRIMACGPTAMLRSVRDVSRREGLGCHLSLEAGMACGMGACLGCAVERREGGYYHVCKDGPVFEAEAVWR